MQILLCGSTERLRELRNAEHSTKHEHEPRRENVRRVNGTRL